MLMASFSLCFSSIFCARKDVLQRAEGDHGGRGQKLVGSRGSGQEHMSGDPLQNGREVRRAQWRRAGKMGKSIISPSALPLPLQVDQADTSSSHSSASASPSRSQAKKKKREFSLLY
jgi:hypothetical protein